jgi:hypothetical protein
MRGERMTEYMGRDPLVDPGAGGGMAHGVLKCSIRGVVPAGDPGGGVQAGLPGRDEAQQRGDGQPAVCVKGWPCSEAEG